MLENGKLLVRIVLAGIKYIERAGNKDLLVLVIRISEVIAYWGKKHCGLV